MIFELWDEAAAFLIDTYTDMNDALHVVASTYREHGERAVHGWRLFRSTPSGESAVPIAQGKDLVHLATRGYLLNGRSHKIPLAQKQRSRTKGVTDAERSRRIYQRYSRY